jgi:hypothetical protein
MSQGAQEIRHATGALLPNPCKHEVWEVEDGVLHCLWCLNSVEAPDDLRDADDNYAQRLLRNRA